MALKPCGICLTPNELFIRVSLECEDNLTVLRKLQIVAPFQDWLNCYSICQNCKNLLDISYRFIDMCSKYEENKTNLTHKEISVKSLQQSDNEENDEENILNIENVDDIRNNTNNKMEYPQEYDIINEITEEEHEQKMEEEFNPTNTIVDEKLIDEEYITIKIESERDIPSLPKDKNNITSIDGIVDHPQEYLCTHCNITFSSYIQLGMHIRFEHGNKCTVCSKVFADEAELEKHVENGHPGYVANFTCEVCNVKFSFANEVIRHCETEHLMKKHTIKPYSCNICEKRVTTLASFKRHLLYHGDRKSFTCTFCGKSFVMKKDMTEHEKIHFNEKKYKCEICDKRFNTYSNLRSHNYCVHSDPSEWKNSCDVCHKRFPWKDRLAEHMRRHYGIKEHQCVVCGSLFISKIDMERHMYYHTKDRPHKCPLCKDKSFRGRKLLQIHMLKHHGDSQFK